MGEEFIPYLKTLTSSYKDSINLSLSECEEVFDIIKDDDSAALNKFVSHFPLNPIQFSGIGEGTPKTLAAYPNLLQMAAYFGSEKCFFLLAGMGSQLHRVDRKGRAIQHFATYGQCIPIIEFIYSINMNFSVQSSKGRTPVHIAAKIGNIDILSIFWAHMEQMDKPTHSGIYPIQYAYIAEKFEVLDFFRRIGVSVHNAFALSLAIKSRKDALFLYLVSSITNLNECYQGKCAIHEAIQPGNYDIVETLIEHGADVNAKTSSGSTPLHIAASKDLESIMILLIEKGAKAASLDKRLVSSSVIGLPRIMQQRAERRTHLLYFGRWAWT